MSKTIVGLDNDRLLDGRYIRRKVVQRKISTKSVTSGSKLYFDIEDIDTANDLDDLIEFSDDGLITINYVGLVRLNVNVWLGGTSATRPWLQIHDITNNDIIGDCIDDSYAGYVNISINDLIINNKASGTQYSVVITTEATATINSGSGRKNSYINLEIL